VSFLKSEPMVKFLTKIIDVGFKKSSSNWFARQEIHFLRLVIEVSHQVSLHCLILLFFFQTSKLGNLGSKIAKLFVTTKLELCGRQLKLKKNLIYILVSVE
jgi:hypothetical protein